MCVPMSVDTVPLSLIHEAMLQIKLYEMVLVFGRPEFVPRRSNEGTVLFAKHPHLFWDLLNLLCNA